MTRTEFIKAIRAMADDLEKETLHILDIEENTIFCNKNYGEVWVTLAKNTTMRVHLYSATDEEKGEVL